MDKMISLYSNYLSEICHCYADENGNRPCDNGAMRSARNLFRRLAL